MELNQLPVPVLINLCSHLSEKDIVRLNQVDKRIHQVICEYVYNNPDVFESRIPQKLREKKPEYYNWLGWSYYCCIEGKCQPTKLLQLNASLNAADRIEYLQWCGRYVGLVMLGVSAFKVSWGHGVGVHLQPSSFFFGCSRAGMISLFPQIVIGIGVSIFLARQIHSLKSQLNEKLSEQESLKLGRLYHLDSPTYTDFCSTLIKSSWLHTWASGIVCSALGGRLLGSLACFLFISRFHFREIQALKRGKYADIQKYIEDICKEELEAFYIKEPLIKTYLQLIEEKQKNSSIDRDVMARIELAIAGRKKYLFSHALSSNKWHISIKNFLQTQDGEVNRLLGMASNGCTLYRQYAYKIMSNIDSKLDNNVSECIEGKSSISLSFLISGKESPKAIIHP